MTKNNISIHTLTVDILTSSDPISLLENYQKPQKPTVNIDSITTLVAKAKYNESMISIAFFEDINNAETKIRSNDLKQAILQTLQSRCTVQHITLQT